MLSRPAGRVPGERLDRGGCRRCGYPGALRCRALYRAEVRQQHIPLRGHHLPAGAQEFGDERVPVRLDGGTVLRVRRHSRLHNASGRCEGTGQECSGGGADELSVHRPAGSRGHGSAGGVDGVAPVEEPGGAYRHPGDGQLGQCVEPAAQPAVLVGLAGDGAVRAVAEDLADQTGEDGAGSGLDEDPGARLVHRLDLRDEADRRADLRGEFGPDRVGVVAVGAAVRLDHTGNSGVRTGRWARACAKRSPAPATSGLWKAQATGMRWAPRPASRRRRMAVATASVGPEITVWRGSCGWR